MLNIYINKITFILFEIFVILIWKTVKSKNVTVENDVNVFIRDVLNNNENDDINFLFVRPYYNMTTDGQIELKIKVNIEFIGNEEKTVIDFPQDNKASLINCSFSGTKPLTVKFKNFIIRNYNTHESYPLFNIQKNEMEYDYQFIFENCIFLNNDSILRVDTYCGKENKQKSIIFNNCDFM